MITFDLPVKFMHTIAHDGQRYVFGCGTGPYIAYNGYRPEIHVFDGKESRRIWRYSPWPSQTVAVTSRIIESSQWYFCTSGKKLLAHYADLWLRVGKNSAIPYPNAIKLRESKLLKPVQLPFMFFKSLRDHCCVTGPYIIFSLHTQPSKKEFAELVHLFTGAENLRDEFLAIDTDKYLILYDREKRSLKTLEVPFSGVLRPFAAPDGLTFAVGNRSGNVAIFDLD